MRDFLATISLVLVIICYLTAGYVYPSTDPHFIYQQWAVVMSFVTMAILSYKKHPIPAIISYGLVFLSATELVDEILRVNTKVRVDDWIFTTLGLTGIIIGIIQYRKQLGKLIL